MDAAKLGLAGSSLKVVRVWAAGGEWGGTPGFLGSPGSLCLGWGGGQGWDLVEALQLPGEPDCPSNEDKQAMINIAQQMYVLTHPPVSKRIHNGFHKRQRNEYLEQARVYTSGPHVTGLGE